MATTQWIFPFFFSSFFRFWLSKGKERKREEGEGVKATKVPLQMAVKRGRRKKNFRQDSSWCGIRQINKVGTFIKTGAQRKQRSIYCLFFVNNACQLPYLAKALPVLRAWSLASLRLHFSFLLFLLFSLSSSSEQGKAFLTFFLFALFLFERGEEQARRVTDCKIVLLSSRFFSPPTPVIPPIHGRKRVFGSQLKRGGRVARLKKKVFLFCSSHLQFVWGSNTFCLPSEVLRGRGKDTLTHRKTRISQKPHAM